MMNKGLKILFAFLCVGFLMVSCSDDHLNQDAGESTLLPIEDVTVHPLGDSFTIAYTSAGPWELKKGNEASWIDVSPLKGDVGTTLIKFTVHPNISVDRSCPIFFFGKSSKSPDESFELSQDKAILSVDFNNHNFGWAKSSGDGVELGVESNIEWALTLADADNFSVDYDGADDGGAEGARKVNIKASKNNFGENPNMTYIILKPVKRDNLGKVVTLQSEVEKALQQQVDLSQDNLIFLVNDVRAGVELETFSELGDDFVKGGLVPESDHLTTQTLVVVSEVRNWGYDSADIEKRLDNWGIELTHKSQVESAELTQKYGRAITVTELEIKVKKPNPIKTMRNCTFDLFVDADNGEKATRTIELRQKAYLFDNKCVGSPDFANLSGTAELEINTTGTWYIDQAEVPSWLTISQFDGVGNGRVKVEAETQNLNFEDLRSAITVYSGLNDIKYTESFTQKRFVFDIEGMDQFKDALSRLDESEHVIYVTSSGPWHLDLRSSTNDDGEKWLDVDVVEGEAGERIPVVLKANSSNPDKINQRAKTINITSDLHESSGVWPVNAKKSFDFIQDKFRFEVMKNGTAVEEENFKAYIKSVNSSKFRMMCSSPWKINNLPEWLEVDITSGTGREYPEITMIAKNNTGVNWSKSRSASIVIASDPMGNGSYSDTKTFTVTQDNFVFSVSSDSFSYNVETLNETTYEMKVNVTEGATWTIIADKWIGVNGSLNRTNSGSLTFKPHQNGSLSYRTGSVNVTCDVLESANQSIHLVRQSAYRFDSSTVTLNKYAEVSPNSQSVSIDCMGAWSVIDKPSWVTLSKESGSGNDVIVVTPKTNESKERSAEFYVVSKVGDVEHKKMISISQNDFVWSKESGNESVTADILYPAAETFSFRASGSWKASSNNSFVTVSPTEGSGGRDATSKVKMSILPNYTFEQRTAKVIVQSDIVTSKKFEINLVQPKYEFTINSNGETFEKAGETKPISYTSTGSLKVDLKGTEWLTFKISGGKVNLTAEPNDTKAERSATIVITSEHYEHNNALRKELVIKQNAK